MSDEYKFGLSDLEVGDDLNVEMDNERYQDQANPAPPAAGKYLANMVTLVSKTTREGKQVSEDGFPIFTLQTIEIIDGLGEGVTRKVAIFHDIKTKPFDRYGEVVSGLGDLTRSLGTENWRGLDPSDPNSGISRLKEAFETKVPFAAQYDWGVYDGDFIKAALEQLSIPSDKDDRSDDDKKIVNAIYKAGRVTGMRFFPFNEKTGRFSHVLVRDNVTMKNPVTNANVVIEGDRRALEARLQITKFIPAGDVTGGRVVFGPSKVRPAALAA